MTWADLWFGLTAVSAIAAVVFLLVVLLFEALLGDGVWKRILCGVAAFLLLAALLAFASAVSRSNQPERCVEVTND